MEKQYIALDEAKFKKTSKKLFTLLQQPDIDITKISHIQEILSKSLGFRNLHDLQKTFSDEIANNLLLNTVPKRLDWKNFSSSELTKIFFIFIHDVDSSSDMWKSRAMSLISSLLIALKFMEEKNEIIFDIELISDYLLLDNFVFLYKRPQFFPQRILRVLKLYLLSLPGFQMLAPKQNESVYEQHSYLLMQFTNILLILKQIEDNDVILFDVDWIDKNKSNNSIIKIDMSSFNLKSDILDIDFIEMSWLFDPFFISIINSLFSKGKLKTFKMSDLIHYSFNMMNHNNHVVTKMIFNNYFSIEKISNNIQKIVN